MANKKNERNIAYKMYVEQNKTAVEISKTLNVSTRTLTEWVNKYKWKEARDAKVNGLSERIENIKRVIANLTEQTLELHTQRKEAISRNDKKAIAAIDVQAVGISDQVSKWNKALADLDKTNRITLSVYLEVMEDVFNHLQMEDSQLYYKTLEFQTKHIQTASQKLG